MKKKYKRTEVAEASAREFARGGALLFLSTSMASDTSHKEAKASWRVDDLKVGVVGKMFSTRPLCIYDIYGRLLFRDFTTPLNDGRELRVRTTANSALGDPVISVGAGKPSAIRSLLSEAKRKARRLKLSFEKGPESLVCYSYPRLGLLCRDTLGKKFVIDLAKAELIRVVRFSTAREQKNLLRTWSPLDRVRTSSATLLRDRWIASVKATRARLANGVSRANFANDAQAFADQKVLAEDRIVLRIQDNLASCSAAVAWMVFDYYKLSLPLQSFLQKIEQAHPEAAAVPLIEYISTVFHIGESGATNKEQIKGYRKLLSQIGGKFDIEGDKTPQIDEAKREIYAGEGRPVKVGSQTHARMVAGWKFEPGPSPDMVGEWLYIYDPYSDVVGPNPFWEKWNTLIYSDYIYIRPEAQGEE